MIWWLACTIHMFVKVDYCFFVITTITFLVSVVQIGWEVCKVPLKEFWFDQTSRSLRCNVKLIKIVYCKVNIFRGSFKFEGCFCSRKLLADVNWECLTLLITVVNFDESFVCSKLSCLTRLLFSVQPIRMSHWCHTMVDGAKFWITCKWLNYWEKLVAYNWFEIQCHLPSCGVFVTSES